MQTWEGKLISQKKETATVELKSQKSSEVYPDLVKESATPLCNGDLKRAEDPKDAKEVLEVMANGVTNAC